MDNKNPGPVVEIEVSLPKPPSLNSWYSSKHWSSRVKQKSKFFAGLQESFKDVPEFSMERFSISVSYRARYDCDNAVTACKLLSDYLVSRGFVDNDSPTYFRKQSTEYNPELNNNEFRATITCYGYRQNS